MRFGSDDGNSDSSSARLTATVRPMLADVLAPSGRNAAIGALLKHGGFTFTFWPPPIGAQLVIGWYQHSRGKSVLIASGNRRFVGRVGKIEVKLTRAGKRLLRSAKKLKLVSKVSFSTVKGHKAFTLRR